jgi:NAD(P)-dependent dehydrogenase (short-subunit alcohol dehydrogenase family)
MADELSGRVAIVTGGARGIGLAIATDLAQHGARVMIIDKGVTIGGEAAEPGAAEAAASKIPGAIALCGDVADGAVATQAVEMAAKHGGVDIVVNNAAIVRDGFIFKTSRDAWDAALRTNLTGAFQLLAAATPLMREQAKNGRAPGAIVNIGSTAGIYGNFGQAAYASAKAGLIGLTRVVAHDLARSKITANVVIPFAATRVTESIQPANDAQAAYKAKALQVSAVYVARLVSFLGSAAANHISGQIFAARGRELFLFSQARPVMKLAVPRDAHDMAGMAEALRTFAPSFTDLVTDLEAFSADPLL